MAVWLLRLLRGPRRRLPQGKPRRSRYRLSRSRAGHGDSERRPSRWPPWVGGKLRLLSRRPGAASEKCDTSEPCPRAIHGIYRGAARSISCRCSVNRRRKSGERGVNRAEEARLASQVSFKVSTWSTHGAWPRGSSRQASFRPWRRSFWSLFATWSNRAHRPPRAKLG